MTSSAAGVGPCSVTYRALPVGQVVELAAQAGLGVVEWGADRHAPPGDLPALRAVRATTEAGGLTARTLRSWLC
ncbi:hypothetical protein [Pseudofrankia sp. BMG5.37]|uniref:hypothetical protein n=1 Tax=Pseudofrankia sp. BMG5.37 TaxID=3050035 RepID=UPI002893CE56|nr:hypothetical protein [Pseudofrankia sp. BMG5.37]MDT3439168.1 hypothetical protein [Pseudofrankia sp. BMG5.37]